MKTTLFNTVSALALTGLVITLAPSTASAHDHARRCSPAGRHCSSLPHGCRSTTYRGERCWSGGGHYYRNCVEGGYTIIEQPEIEETVVQRRCVKKVVVEQPVEEEVVVEKKVVEEQPVVEETEEVVEQPTYEDEETVACIPQHCTQVYVGKERCWYDGGYYYRHCGSHYTKFHCHNRGHYSHCSSHRRPECHGRRVSHECHTPRHCSSSSRHCKTGDRVGHHNHR